MIFQNKYLLFYTIFFLIVSCKQGPVDYNESNYTFKFPLAIGNQWIYQDSIDGIESIDTTEIVSSFDSLGHTWWQLRNEGYATAHLKDKLIMTGDTILTLYPCWEDDNLEVTLCLPRDTTFRIFRPLCDAGISADVIKGEGELVLPSGTFDDWGSNVWRAGETTDSIVIVSNVGIVSRTITGFISGPTGRQPYKYISVLLSYNIIGN